MEVKITPHSRVKFYPLFTKKEQGEYIVGRSDTEVFIGIPRSGEEIIRTLRKRHTVSETERILKKEFGKLDVKDFCRTLVEEGFIKSIDGTLIKDKHKKVHHVLSGVDKKHTWFLFSWPAYVIYAAIILTGVYFFVSTPKYLPRFRDFFFTESLTIVYLVAFVMGWVFLFFHEMWHFLACRSLDVPASFSISHRSVFPVVETDMTDIWEVDPKRRYRAYAAGMLSDLLILSFIIFLMKLNDTGSIALGVFLYNMLKLGVLLLILKLLWQFLFFMETDVYYIIGNFFRVSDLMGDTKSYTRYILSRAMFRRKSRPKIERPGITKAYSGLWVVGSAVTLFRFFWFQLPIVFALVIRTISRISFQSSAPVILDGMFLVVLALSDYIILIYALIKEHRQQFKKISVLHILHHLLHKRKHEHIHR